MNKKNENKDQTQETTSTNFSSSDFDDLMDLVEGSTETEASEAVEEAAPADVKPAAETEPEPESEEPDELTLLRNQNKLLTEQLNTISATTPPVEAPKEAEPEVEVSFFGDWKFDEIIADEDSFKKFLGDFAKKISESTEERVLKKLPGTVSKLTNEQIEARQCVNTFYANHEQLAAVKPFMAKVVTSVAAEHADWDLEKVLEESAVRAYKALGLKAQVKTEGDTSAARTSKKPAFAGPASGRRGETAQAQKSQLEKELEEMMEIE